MISDARSAALAAGVLWLSFPIHAFRPIWEPLLEVEGDVGSGIRRLVFVACALFVLRALLLGGRLNRIVERHFAWLLFAVGLAATSVYSTRPELTVTRSVVFALGLLVLLGLVELARDPIRFLLVAMTSVVGAAAWISLGMWLTLPAPFWSLASRPGLAGISSHPNVLGPCLAIGWLASLGLTVPRDPRARSGLRFAQLGIAGALVLTDSIAAILMALVGTVLLGILATSSYRRGAAWLLFAFVGAAVAIDPGTILSGALDSVGRDASLSGRDQLWAAVSRKFGLEPVVGVGYGAFWYEGRGREIVGTWSPRQSHNAYLDVLVDIGGLGMLLLALIVLCSVGRGWRLHWNAPREKRRPSAALLAIVLGLLGVGAFSESFLLKMDKFQFFALAWILLCFDREHHRAGHRFAAGAVSGPDRSARRSRCWRRGRGRQR